MSDTPTPRDVIAREVATTRHPTTKELMIGRGAKKRADAILSALTAAGYVVVPREATEEMHDAARDWSLAKYGQGIGFDASLGCYRAMIAAATKESEG